MFIWLPPSESKSTPTSGPTLDLKTLTHASLEPERTKLINALEALGADEQAAKLLGLGPTKTHEARANLHLLHSPCAPARELFTGVLFNALALPSLNAEQKECAHRSIRIFSGLFGVLSPEDLVPDHRLSIASKLPGVLPLAKYWRPALGEALRAEAEGECVVDARSGGYAAACTAPWAHLISIRAAREREGKRQVISHDAKRWRGLACKELLALGANASLDEVVEALSALAGTISITDAKGRVHQITDVEIFEAKPSREGGSTRVLTLVTD
ncbi:peroxide stress protein YaaA [Schaalia cardiffensis]|uniref:YaaA family protein n=1 Tax=Schaalia cardiffensis TaxID=181487 RepID=UPI002AAF1F7E|nr:peroxide stress protein YaaA [Schaalia cardiffensis]